LLKSMYMEAVYGLTVTGFVTGSSLLHPRSSEGLHSFGPTEEVRNMVDLLVRDQHDVHAFVKTCIL
jgi:hypothetical protein